MKLKTKISWKKILQFTVTAVVSVACCIAILSAAEIQQKRKIKGVKININNNRYGFIDKGEIKRMLDEKHIDVANKNLAKLNVHLIEDSIRAIPWVDNAQVYIDNARVLHVSITQRVPVARLFDQAGNSYYVDNTLKAMPLSDRYIHYTTVVTNVPVFTNDTLDMNFKAQTVALVKRIDRDSFWSAQISQIMVTDSQEFELMPVLGNHKIIFGDTTHLNEKFDNLFAFYKNVLNRVGWDKYEILDVRFDRQVVASPALPWKAPVDKAATNMNWVKSIIGDEPKTATTVTTPVVSVPAVVNNTKPALPAVKPATVKPLPQAPPKPEQKKIVLDAKPAKPKKETVKKEEKAEPKEEKITPKYLYKGE